MVQLTAWAGQTSVTPGETRRLASRHHLVPQAGAGSALQWHRIKFICFCLSVRIWAKSNIHSNFALLVRQHLIVMVVSALAFARAAQLCLP
jgi:hypothetical protein